MTPEDFTDFAVAAMPKLQRLALALCGGNPHEANDLVQATLERVLLAWTKHAPRNPFAYARTVLTHELASSRRRLRWKREHLTGDVGTPDSTGEDVAEHASASLTLIRALGDLPPRQRHTVVLRYLEDLSVEEVAALLNCSPGTVKRASYDGLRSLRALMSSSGTEIAAQPGSTHDHR